MTGVSSPGRLFAEIDWLPLLGGAVAAPMIPVISAADPIELANIEARLMLSTHGKKNQRQT